MNAGISNLVQSPSWYFEHTDAFRDVYLLGPKGTEVPGGHTDQQPLRLDGVDAAEFRRLLKAMFGSECSGFNILYRDPILQAADT